ncbi:hypothetical protein HME9304_03167 [Flagellimonas maritima]|uniref:DUF1801 domain-containing protein n=1 Tax=Flagellimonas maritima TaxID=1383885 RepID=A0A2Z4LW01_9FLAO|nr:hypothetical protein [Allomuricauda aurantiaca]AWX46135.1 hypothetical protein HME9304_03167 [Allomuricauda aurantiaca]
MDNTHFTQIFEADSKALQMGLVLRKLVFSSFSNIDESIAGGAKVKLALYSRGGKNNVLCGIQKGAGDSCMLYVHHIDKIDHDRLKFSGSGKHAKRIKFFDEKEIVEDDIVWLFNLVKQNAPY